MLLVLGLAACSKESTTPTEAERADVVGRLDAATQLVGQFRPEIPDQVAERAECVLVFPGLKRGGIVVGGEGGKGFATCYSNGAWSDPGPINIGGGTLGAQIGFQSADVVSLLTSNRAEKALDSGNLKIGVNASATAGPVGTGRAASGDVTVTSDIVSYSRSSGLFAGATLDGTSVSADGDSIRALYGSSVSLGDILTRSATLPQQPATQRFRAAVGAAFVPAAVGMLGRSSRE